MSKKIASTASNTKGPAITAKGKMPPDHLARWKTTNLSFPITLRGRRNKATKRAIEGWKTVIRMRVPSVPYNRLPANLRGAIVDLLDPLVNNASGFNSRRDKTGGEGGEIVPAS